MFTHIIFDFDGTLENWAPHEAAVDKKLAAAMQTRYHISQDTWLEVWDRIKRMHVHPHARPEEYSRVLWITEAFAMLNRAAPPIEVIDALVNTYWGWVEQRVELFPNTESVLQRLRDHFTLIMFSDSDGNKSIKMRRIGRLGVVHYFHKIFTSDDFGVNKPDPSAYTQMCKLIKAPPSHCVMVGDVPHRDLFGAKAVGMHTVFTNFIGSHAHGNYIDWTIHDLDELPPLLFAHAKNS